MLEELIESLFSNFRHSFSRIYPSWLQVEPWLIPLIAIVTAAFLVITIIWGIRAHHRQISAGREDLIGKSAQVKTAMNPKGMVLIQGELWAAILEEGQAEPGDEVAITKVNHLEVWVTKSTKVPF
ncbi:NfeD family protein [Chloroflexota bacterium]